MRKDKKSPVGRRLKEARLEFGCSQKDLGIKAGIDRFAASPRINQYETGKHAPDYGTLERIGKVLNITAAYFYCEDDNLAILIKNWKKLSKKDQKLILSCVKK